MSNAARRRLAEPPERRRVPAAAFASPGVGTHVFTPVGLGPTNSAGLATTNFDSPNDFTLYVTKMPEPAMIAALAAATAATIVRPRGSCRRKGCRP